MSRNSISAWSSSRSSVNESTIVPSVALPLRSGRTTAEWMPRSLTSGYRSTNSSPETMNRTPCLMPSADGTLAVRGKLLHTSGSSGRPPLIATSRADSPSGLTSVMVDTVAPTAAAPWFTTVCETSSTVSAPTSALVTRARRVNRSESGALGVGSGGMARTVSQHRGGVLRRLATPSPVRVELDQTSPARTLLRPLCLRRNLTPMQPPDRGSEHTEQVMSDLIRGSWRSLAARAMAELRLADALAEPGTAEQVAPRVGAHAPTLDRLLRTLAALELVTHRDGVYTLTAAGQRLRSDVPGSDWGGIMMMAAPWTLATWSELPESVRTGQPAFERANGQPFWEYLRTHEDARTYFDAAMARGSRDRDPVALLVSEVESSGATTVVDVGGGTGRLLSQVVAGVPTARGILADQETTIGGAGAVFEEHGVSDRCEAVVCDFFAGVPTGDAYLLSNILHDWDDDRCREILSRIREAAAPGARVVVVETVVPDESDGVLPETAPLHLLDLAMLLNFGARERTLAEYTALLEATGFDDVRLVSQTGRSLVVARAQ